MSRPNRQDSKHRDRLQQALDLYERDGFRAPLEPLVTAARSVLEGERWWVCATHKSAHYPTATGPHICEKAHIVGTFHKPCRFVERLLVDPEGMG